MFSERACIKVLLLIVRFSSIEKCCRGDYEQERTSKFSQDGNENQVGLKATQDSVSEEGDSAFSSGSGDSPVRKWDA